MPGDGGREGTELVAVYRREGTDPDEEYSLRAATPGAATPEAARIIPSTVT
jgi:hypothetical protein